MVAEGLSVMQPSFSGQFGCVHTHGVAQTPERQMFERQSASTRHVSPVRPPVGIVTCGVQRAVYASQWPEKQSASLAQSGVQCPLKQ
jgi:hypothetical protein